MLPEQQIRCLGRRGVSIHGGRLGIGVLIAAVVAAVTRSFSWQSAVREYDTHNTPSIISEVAFPWAVAVLINPTKARKKISSKLTRYMQ